MALWLTSICQYIGHRMIRIVLILILTAWLPACTLPAPPQPTTPRPTAPVILEITPAPTLDVDATATAYANLLALSPTPAGLYIVQPGDTLSELAIMFGTTVADIMAANGLTDPDSLQVGQPLIIPSLVDTSPSLRASPTVASGLAEATPIPATPTLTTP
jgi:FOG: LysM repeat